MVKRVRPADYANWLMGGAGADRLIFSALGDSPAQSQDAVMDFMQGEDKVLFRGAFLEDGPLHFIGIDDFSHTAGEVRFVAVNGVITVAVDPDGDGQSDSLILFIGEIHFQASDFSF